MNLRPFEEFTDHFHYSRLNIHRFIHIINFGGMILPPPGKNRVKGPRVPLGDFFRKRVPFWSPFYQKVPFSSKMYIIWGNYENHGMINWTFLIHIGCWHKKFLGKFIILFGKWKTLNYDSFERIPHFFPRLRHFGVPFLASFGSPLGPLFCEKGSPLVPLRGPERVP